MVSTRLLALFSTSLHTGRYLNRNGGGGRSHAHLGDWTPSTVACGPAVGTNVRLELRVRECGEGGGAVAQEHPGFFFIIQIVFVLGQVCGLKERLAALPGLALLQDLEGRVALRNTLLCPSAPSAPAGCEAPRSGLSSGTSISPLP